MLWQIYGVQPLYGTHGLGHGSTAVTCIRTHRRNRMIIEAILGSHHGAFEYKEDRTWFIVLTQTWNQGTIWFYLNRIWRSREQGNSSHELATKATSEWFQVAIAVSIHTCLNSHKPLLYEVCYNCFCILRFGGMNSRCLSCANVPEIASFMEWIRWVVVCIPTSI